MRGSRCTPTARSTILSPAAEMGQGSLTSLPVILADEMDADWAKVRIVPAPPNGKLYGNPAFGGEQYTAGSATVTGYFNSLRQLRRAGALRADGQRRAPLGRSARRADDQPGVVLHEKTGRRIGYGEIAAFATGPGPGAGGRDRAGRRRRSSA